MGKHEEYPAELRVLCIMWALGHISERQVCREIATTMDLVPTFASISQYMVDVDVALAVDNRSIVHDEPVRERDGAVANISDPSWSLSSDQAGQPSECHKKRACQDFIIEISPYIRQEATSHASGQRPR